MSYAPARFNSQPDVDKRSTGGRDPLRSAAPLCPCPRRGATCLLNHWRLSAHDGSSRRAPLSAIER